MKKHLILMCVCLFCLTACGGALKIYDYAKNNVAEVRQNLYVGESENLKVTLNSGFREKDYVVNGFCTESIEFGVLTFVFKVEHSLPETINYVLTVGTIRFDGLLEQNPYDGSYVCDVKKLINSTDVISAKIIAGDFVESVEIKSVSESWNVNYDNALRLACLELKTELTSFIENDEFYGECYIKIINDEEVGKDNYFWYVNFVSRKGKTYAVVINPITNEIMAKKIV